MKRSDGTRQAVPDRRREQPAESTGQILWLVLAVLVAGGPHFLFLQPWIPVMVAVIASWRMAAAIKRWSLPGAWIRVPLTVLGFAAVLLTYRQVSGLDAGSALLLVMVAMKLLETRGHRDRAVVVFICYFLLFAGFLREQALWSVIYLLLGVTVTTAGLLQTSRRGSVVSLTTALGTASSLVLQAVPLMAVLFLLFPRIPGPFWALPQTGGQAVTGLAESMSPGDITRLALSDKVAFRVQFDGSAPRVADLYWRGPVLSEFDGRTWNYQRVGSLIGYTEPELTDEPVYSYELTLEPHGRRWLLALETPLAWSAAQSFLSTAYQLINYIGVEPRISNASAGRAQPTGRDVCPRAARGQHGRP